LQGSIDDIRIYDKALEQEHIETLFSLKTIPLFSFKTPHLAITNKTQNFVEIETSQEGDLSFLGECAFTPTAVQAGATFLTLTNQDKKVYQNCQIIFTPQSGGFSQNFPLSDFTLSYKGDIDRDTKVDIFDFNIFVYHFGKSECAHPADLNDDCKVDIFDFNWFLNDFGKSVL
jgi:hypothetical protein